MASDDKLNITLEPRIDGDGNKYFIGKLKGPISIDCEKGVAFLIFISSEGEETLQISNITQPNNKYSKQ